MTTDFDTVVIGSGFGGAMVARPIVHAGERVLMLERGGWVSRGPVAWEAEASLTLGPHWELWASADGGGRRRGADHVNGVASCVGGPSVFYGGVSLRFREADFEPSPGIVGESGARWPLGYDVLEPYYTQAEQILQVAGEAPRDPTEPRHGAPYPQKLPAWCPASQRLADAAERLGLTPFRLPLAINHNADETRPECVRCPTCDTFACAVHSKNDLATCVIPELMQAGMRLDANTEAVRLVADSSGSVVGVECRDGTTGERRVYRGRRYVLSAGAIASSRLLLASGLESLNPAGGHVGRYLMRHCSAIVYGLFPRRPETSGGFLKEIGVHDFYFGHRTVPWPRDKIGGLQGMPQPPVALVKTMLPFGVRGLASAGVRRLLGMLAIAEDQPQYRNRVVLDAQAGRSSDGRDFRLAHAYSDRDVAARDVLVTAARRILRRAGAWAFYTHRIPTFSHALGTVRMGDDERTSPLDSWCRFRGVPNLYVVDGSCFPTSAAVNPSLTIAANALRVGEHLARACR